MGRGCYLRGALEAPGGKIEPAELVPDEASLMEEGRGLEGSGRNSEGESGDKEHVGSDVTELRQLGLAGRCVGAEELGGIGEVDAGVPEAVAELPYMDLDGLREVGGGGGLIQRGKGEAEAGGETRRGARGVEGFSYLDGGLDVVEEEAEDRRRVRGGGAEVRRGELRDLHPAEEVRFSLHPEPAAVFQITSGTCHSLLVLVRTTS